MTKTLLAGNKFNSRHQTYIPGAVPFLKDLKALDCVKKIILGPINTTKPGKIKAKIRNIQDHRIEILFRDTKAVQIFNIISSDPDRVKNLVAKYGSK